MITKTDFHDTFALDNLTSDIYYCLSATDLNFNISIKSDTILIIKPDTIAPIPCVLKNVKLQDSVLNIIWVNSENQDLKTSLLLRQHDNITDTIYQWNNATDASFSDQNINPGSNYTYFISTFDKSDNHSKSRSFNKFYEPGYRKPLTHFTVDANMDEKLIILSWDLPKEKVYSYQVFRTKEGGKLKLIKTIAQASENAFKDKNVSINNKYFYSVKYINMDGIHSIPAKGSVIYQ